MQIYELYSSPTWNLVCGDVYVFAVLVHFFYVLLQNLVHRTNHWNSNVTNDIGHSLGMVNKGMLILNQLCWNCLTKAFWI